MSGGYVSLCVYVMKEVFLMAEDFVGVSGSLNESFVGAANDKLFEVPFEALEVRMAKEKTAACTRTDGFEESYVCACV